MLSIATGILLSAPRHYYTGSLLCLLLYLASHNDALPLDNYACLPVAPWKRKLCTQMFVHHCFPGVCMGSIIGKA